MDDAEESVTTRDLLDDEDDVDGSINRKTALLYVTPFLLLGLFDLVLLLGWGLDPLWGFMILPPILFVSVLTWIAFRSGFVNGRSE